MRVRYHKATVFTEWQECQKVTVKEGALVIELTDTSVDMVPLHYIKGVIEVRDIPLPPPPPPEPQQPAQSVGVSPV